MGLAANLAGPGKNHLARGPAEEYGAWGVLGCSNPMTSEAARRSDDFEFEVLP